MKCSVFGVRFSDSKWVASDRVTVHGSERPMKARRVSEALRQISSLTRRASNKMHVRPVNGYSDCVSSIRNLQFAIRNSQSPLSSRRGLSLLEVVLALAILAVAAAYLAQSMHLAVENATRAQRISRAEVVAESVMNQIVAGFLPVQPVSWTPFHSANPFGTSALSVEGEQWVYSIQNVQTEVPGMLGVQVGVRQVIPGELQDYQPDLIVNRWIINPQLGLDVPPDTSTLSGGSQ